MLTRAFHKPTLGLARQSIAVGVGVLYVCFFGGEGYEGSLEATLSIRSDAHRWQLEQGERKRQGQHLFSEAEFNLLGRRRRAIP